MDQGVYCGVPVASAFQVLLQLFGSFCVVFIARAYSSYSKALAIGDGSGAMFRVAALRREVLVGVSRFGVEVSVDGTCI